MPNYLVQVETPHHFAEVEIEASSAEDAIEAAKLFMKNDQCLNWDWEDHDLDPTPQNIIARGDEDAGDYAEWEATEGLLSDSDRLCEVERRIREALTVLSTAGVNERNRGSGIIERVEQILTKKEGN